MDQKWVVGVAVVVRVTVVSYRIFLSIGLLICCSRICCPSLPQTSIFKFKMARDKNSKKQSFEYILKSLVAGSIAGSLAKTVIAPLDRVKILFQTTHPSYDKYTKSFSGPFRAMADIYASDGIMGLFKGHSATVLRIVPYVYHN